MALSVVAAAVLLAGCSLISGILHTNNALRDAGFSDPSVNLHSSNGYAVVDVTTDSSSSASAATPQGQQVAQIVWDNLPGRFDALHVTVRGVGSDTYSHARLVSLFGPRPGNLDQQTISQEITSAGGSVAIGLLVGVLIVVALILVVVFAVRRKRRQQRQSYNQLVMATLPPHAWGYASPTYGAAGYEAGAPPVAGWPPPGAPPGMAPAGGPGAPAAPGWPPQPVPPGGWPGPPGTPGGPPVAGWPPPPGAAGAPAEGSHGDEGLPAAVPDPAADRGPGGGPAHDAPGPGTGDGDTGGAAGTAGTGSDQAW